MTTRTSAAELFYTLDEPRQRELIPNKVEAIRFRRGTTDSRRYIGDAVVEVVRNDGSVERLPQRYVFHSPDGFEFGYGGSGPADTALNVLALFVPLKEATRLHQAFKITFIERLNPTNGGDVSETEIIRWLRERWAYETRLEHRAVMEDSLPKAT